MDPKRTRAREGSGARTSPSHALEGAHVDIGRCQGIPKTGDVAAPLTLGRGTPRVRVPTLYLSGKSGTLGPMQRAAFGCKLASLHRATTAATGTGANKGKRKAGPLQEGGGIRSTRRFSEPIVLPGRSRTHVVMRGFSQRGSLAPLLSWPAPGWPLRLEGAAADPGKRRPR